MTKRVYQLTGAMLPIIALLTVAGAAPKAPKAVSYRESIEPIFKADCSGCHGKEAASGGLAMDTVEGLRKGGTKYAGKLIVPGNPKASALIAYLRGTHQPQMPMGMPPLSEAKIALVETWIAQGAPIDAEKVGWPYTPLSKPNPPVLKTANAATFTNPVDRFVVAKLSAKKLGLAPPASKSVLLRRVYLDVVGVPPTPQEADAFYADKSPEAYAKLVDRLLADPRYGERWARHWLDLVRYAETHGFEADNVRPRAWRYRDYVISAFNQDKSYFRFLQEQVAGDELWPDDPQAEVATGFLRLAAYDELATDPAQRRQDVLNDATDTFSSAVMGMTVGCARCHDHKYDRITQRDYYRLQAFFTNTNWSDRRIDDVADTPTVTEQRNRLKATLTQARDAVNAYRKELQQAMGKTDANDDTIKEWLKTPEHTTEREKWERLRDAQDDAYRALIPIDSVAEGITEPNADVPTQPLLMRGNLMTPGDKLKPGFITAFAGGTEKDATITRPANGKSSGARSALANWIASPTNPMPARVMVNRLWQHHFGNGIVATPSDFGRNGSKPSHPELLDWLAGELIRQKGSLKSLHRLILTSRAYQQSIVANPVAQKIDPENRLLWRQNRQRMEAEVIRDSMLAVSGGLNPERGGPSVYPEVSDEVLATGSTHKWGNSAPDQQRRRSIYVFQRRSLPLPLVEAFDGPDMVNSCPRRNTTTIAPQALAMFNGAFGWTEAKRLADRLTLLDSTIQARIADAYRLSFARRPSAAETVAAANFIEKKRKMHAASGVKAADKVALADFCHVLFNTNEFVYID